MVRRHRSQSTTSFESTIGIFDAPMAFEQSPACEGAEGDMPDAIINFLKADRCSTADV